MECPGHKGIVIRRIAENYQLCTAQRIIFFRIFCCLKHNFAHELYRIHINTGFGGSHIDGTADTFCLSKGHWNGTNQIFISLCHSFWHQCGIAADKIYPHCFGSSVQGSGYCHKILRRLAGCLAHQCNGSYRNPFIYNGNTVIALNFFSCLHQVRSCCGDFFIDIFI